MCVCELRSFLMPTAVRMFAQKARYDRSIYAAHCEVGHNFINEHGRKERSNKSGLLYAVSYRSASELDCLHKWKYGERIKKKKKKKRENTKS